MLNPKLWDDTEKISVLVIYANFAIIINTRMLIKFGVICKKDLP